MGLQTDLSNNEPSPAGTALPLPLFLFDGCISLTHKSQIPDIRIPPPKEKILLPFTITQGIPHLRDSVDLEC